MDQDKHLATRDAVNGLTLLHWSCYGVHIKLAGALFERDADVRAKILYGSDACFAGLCGREEW